MSTYSLEDASLIKNKSDRIDLFLKFEKVRGSDLISHAINIPKGSSNKLIAQKLRRFANQIEDMD